VTRFYAKTNKDIFTCGKENGEVWNRRRFRDSYLKRARHVVAGHLGRRIAHKFMNDLVLRVVYVEDDAIVVVTVYPARRERYAKAV